MQTFGPIENVPKLAGIAPLVHSFFWELLAEYFAYTNGNSLCSAMHDDLGGIHLLSTLVTTRRKGTLVAAQNPRQLTANYRQISKG
jgi:hypothetical protein